MKSTRSGVLSVLCAAVLFSTGGLLIKLIPWSAMAINGARSLISTILIGLYLWTTKQKIRFSPGIVLGAVATFLTCSLFILANKMTTAANAIILQYTAPVFLILFMALFFREKPGGLDILTCILVFAGIVLFFLDSLSTGHYAGDLIALVAGMSYAGVFMLNRLPGAHPISSVIIGHGLCAVIGLPSILHETDFSPSTLLWIALLGMFQMALAYILLCHGLKSVSPVTSSLITGIEPILSPILVMMVFPSEKLSPLAIAGAFLVIVTVLVYNVLKAKRMRTDG